MTSIIIKLPPVLEDFVSITAKTMVNPSKMDAWKNFGPYFAMSLRRTMYLLENRIQARDSNVVLDFITVDQLQKVTLDEVISLDTLAPHSFGRLKKDLPQLIADIVNRMTVQNSNLNPEQRRQILNIVISAVNNYIATSGTPSYK